jgi:magnesium-transporting ATPase (P-type)
MAGSRSATDIGNRGAVDAGPAPGAYQAADGSRGAFSGGLTSAEAATLLAEVGPNALPAAKKDGIIRRIIAQITNPLIYVLLGSATISLLMGHFVDSAVILAVVVINAAVGIVQEGRAEKALDAIRSLLAPRASVWRDGRRISIDAAEVVPGDLLLLEAGDRVVADARIIKERNLRIDESILTGESVAVGKSALPVGDPGEGSEAFSGTLVVAGQGTAVVTATGARSRLGQITALLGRVEELQTPLVRQMNAFARRATAVVLALSALTFAYAVLIGGYAMSDAFMVVVGMAVAVIPEGLPAVTTITMAIGVQRMAGRNAILRRLPAIETLGCVSTICSDKTGTLTKNEMTVKRIVTAAGEVEVSGVGYEPAGGFSSGGVAIDAACDPMLQRLLRSAGLCNEAHVRRMGGGWIVDGDPLEGALIVAAAKAGHEAAGLRSRYPRVDEIPFDASYRYMATLHREPGGSAFVCAKGAPEELIQMCDRQLGVNGEEPLDQTYWTRAVEGLAASGFRVLALASKAYAGGERLSFADIGGFVFEGLVGLIDPPREEAMAAIAECRSAGIAVKMITGDHLVTAQAIAAQLGIDARRPAVAGESLDRLDDAALAKLAAETSVFARTTPEHKLRLVEALQSDGNVVAMTGDGVNDAPALKRADVGVAMGRNGTEAAKEAAEMVLLDDNFASIVAAVREGRAVYDNLTKVIGWTLPTSGGQMLVIMLAILFGLTLPITPVQILWVNTISAGVLGLILAFEPAEPDIMMRGPRHVRESLLSKFLLWRVLLVSMLFALGAFGVFEWAISRGADIGTARTMVVNAIVAMGIGYLFNVRYLRSASLTWRGMLGTRAVLIGIGAVALLQLAFTYLPVMNQVFETRPMTLTEGAVAISVGAALFFLLELEKQLQRRLNPTMRSAAKGELGSLT